MPGSFLNRSFGRSGKNADASANNNTIFEKESPVQGKKRRNNTFCVAPIKSPQSKFQRHNSEPFPETVKCTTAEQETPKKSDDSSQQKSLGKFLKFIRPNSGKKKRHLNLDGTFKVREVDSSVLSDELPSPQQTSCQAYEKSINKHGDVVEYAVPYSELLSPIAALNDTISTSCVTLTDHNALDEPWIDQLLDKKASRNLRLLKVTDLDKSSSCGYRSINQNGEGFDVSHNRDALSELDSLERWSQDMAKRDLFAEEPPIDLTLRIIECKPRDIKPKRSVLRNTIALPLYFSSGLFRKAPVALRSCCPRDSVAVGLVEEAIERDLDILNKVKHSNIILLMAVSFQKKSLEHMTLVLEPVDYTLNYFLHQMDTTLSVVESISIVQQIAGAALYLQECGYIHSNISSHCILVRENPWCVKLSSFELTTEVNFDRKRDEIMVKYNHNPSSSNKQCPDTPRYATVVNPTLSLKEQYRQMSKLLPMLSCSNTQHKYLDMISRHLIYDTNYRSHLSLHNFHAPELLTTKLQFVFPTTKADVYSLCLLLWEMLNNCVPFVVYSRLDMERMIATKKLNLPIFEQERCQPVKEILRIGLALNPDDRTIDVQQLIRLLEDIKFQIRSGAKYLDNERHEPQNNIDQRINLFVNTAAEKHPIRRAIAASSIQSLNSIDFSHRLLESEATSTAKRQKKSPQKVVKKKGVFRQLFKSFKETDNDSKCARNFQLDDEPLAFEIPCDQSLDEIQEEGSSIEAPLSSEENEFLSNNSLEKHMDRDDSSERNNEWHKASPELVDVEVNVDSQSFNSKSFSNLFNSSASKPRAQFFECNIISPPGFGSFDVGKYSLPDMPIARINKIRRNAWLSQNRLNLTNKENSKLTMENRDHKSQNDSNQLNVSIRIVHNKVIPKKDPLVMSRVKFFDSSTEASIPPTSFSNDSNTNGEEDIDTNGEEDIDLNCSANYPIKDSSCKELIELATDDQNSLPDSSCPSTDISTDRNRTLSDCSTLSQSECSDIRNRPSNLDQRNNSFENKFWKRELNICNRSQGSDHTDENADTLPRKWQSVRDKILKFEKQGLLTMKPLTTAAEFVRNLSKSVASTQSNDKSLTETPTIIKRTIYSESTMKVSGVDFAVLYNQLPLFDQLNVPGQKLTTQVTLNMRQIRRRSLDMDDVDRPKIEGKTGIRHTVCGSQNGLLSVNVGVSTDGSTGGKTKYICSDCTTKISSGKMKDLTFESVAESSLNETNDTTGQSSPATTNSPSTPRRHCQVRMTSENTNLIEDMYIDDDFDQGFGLGANIELQSDSSDFLNFDISDIFNKCKVEC